MVYQSPAIRYRGLLIEILDGLISRSGYESPLGDLRVCKLREFIDSREGGLGWDLRHVCEELRLDISAAYAARLFKRHMGFGVRDYAKGKRLLVAAERLRTTGTPVKVIAADLGYRTPFDFARRFKQQFQLSPSEFRKRTMRGTGNVPIEVSRSRSPGRLTGEKACAE